ncbi:MAG: hypothetical protein IJU18_07090, partial [Oscillospiraceae bacterium]|nr:hypothetical protein [Oscillospiraceae bacterium]
VDQSLVWLGAAAGVLFCVLMFFCIVINDRIVQKRYRKIENQFTKEVIYRENANFCIQGKIKSPDPVGAFLLPEKTAEKQLQPTRAGRLRGI